MSPDLAWNVVWWGLPGLAALVLLGGCVCRRSALQLLRGAGPAQQVRWSTPEPVPRRQIRQWWAQLRIASYSLLAVLMLLVFVTLHHTEPGDLTLARVYGPHIVVISGVVMIEAILRSTDPLPPAPDRRRHGTVDSAGWVHGIPNDNARSGDGGGGSGSGGSGSGGSGFGGGGSGS